MPSGEVKMPAVISEPANSKDVSRRFSYMYTCPYLSGCMSHNLSIDGTKYFLAKEKLQQSLKYSFSFYEFIVHGLAES